MPCLSVDDRGSVEQAADPVRSRWDFSTRSLLGRKQAARTAPGFDVRSHTVSLRLRNFGPSSVDPRGGAEAKVRGRRPRCGLQPGLTCGRPTPPARYRRRRLSLAWVPPKRAVCRAGNPAGEMSHVLGVALLIIGRVCDQHGHLDDAVQAAAGGIEDGCDGEKAHS